MCLQHGTGVGRRCSATRCMLEGARCILLHPGLLLLGLASTGGMLSDYLEHLGVLTICCAPVAYIVAAASSAAVLQNV
jgi:hypothetical protein